jgi:hypothetical protein
MEKQKAIVLAIGLQYIFILSKVQVSICGCVCKMFSLKIFERRQYFNEYKHLYAEGIQVFVFSGLVHQLNFSTPFTFIFKEVNLSTGPVINKVLLLGPPKTLLVAPLPVGILKILLPLGAKAVTP